MKEYLTSLLINEIGLDIENTYILDQDYGNIITFNNKYVRYFQENDERINEIDKRENIILDINNVRILNILFGYYLEKLYNLEGKYFKRYYQINNKNGSGRIEAVTTSEEIISSDTFFNENLRYIDIILKLSDNTLDLHEFDIK